MMRLCHSITLGSVIIYGKILLTNQQKMTVLNAAHLEACLGIESQASNLEDTDEKHGSPLWNGNGWMVSTLMTIAAQAHCNFGWILASLEWGPIIIYSKAIYHLVICYIAMV